MIMVVNRIIPPLERAAEFEASFLSENSMQGTPGLLGFEFWKEKDKNEYMVITRWETEEDFHTWRQSDSFRQAHQGINGQNNTTELGIYEVLSSKPNPWHQKP